MTQSQERAGRIRGNGPFVKGPFPSDPHPHKLPVLLCIFATCWLLLLSAAVHAWQGLCVRVIDGDTIVVNSGPDKDETVRLCGIDCPEKKQAFGPEARRFTANLVLGKFVEIVPNIRRGKYGRVIGLVLVERINVNEALISAGMAWQYKRCRTGDDLFQMLEADARRREVGLWSAPDPVPPWVWRHTPKTMKR